MWDITLKIAIIPYVPAGSLRNGAGTSTADPVKIVGNLRSFLGPLPPGAKILSSTSQEGRDIASSLEAEIGSAETLFFSWIAPKGRRKVDVGQVKTAFNAMVNMDPPFIALVVPATLLTFYSDQILDFLDFERPSGVLSPNKVVFIDSNAPDALRLIPVS